MVLLRSGAAVPRTPGSVRPPGPGHRARGDRRQLGASWLIARADRSSLNVEGAFQHILNDLFAFIATALAGLVVLLTGWARADAVAALVVAAPMAKAGWGLLRDSGRIS